MIDVRKLIGLNTEANPPDWFESVYLTPEEQIQFVDIVRGKPEPEPDRFIEAEKLPYYQEREQAARAVMEARSVVGIRRGHSRFKEALDKARENPQWRSLGVGFGREWFAIPPT